MTLLPTGSRSFISRYAIGLIIISLATTTIAHAQVTYQSTGVKLVIKGTSNIHDWDMKSGKGTGAATFTLSPSGIPTSISALRFSLPAESLKSESSSMDKNAYKAMQTSKYGTISFVADQGSIQATGGSALTLRIPGKLTISGTTKDVVIAATGKLAADNSILWSGTHTMKMTDFNVKPPSIMFGAIKTGDKITIQYELTLKPQ